MSQPVVCHGCGETLKIPEDFTRLKMRCPGCGVYCEVPPNAPRVPAAPETVPPVAKKQNERKSVPPPEPVAELPPLIAGTEEDDGKPYTVPGDPDELRRQSERKEPPPPKPPVAKSWEIGWPFQKRMAVFAVVGTANVIAVPFTWTMFPNVAAVLLTFWFTTSLEAFLLGTYDRIDLTRSRKGHVCLTRTWRVAFIPMKPAVLRCAEFEGIIIARLHEPKWEDWFMMLMLLPYGLIPAILWWWFVIRPERVHVALCKDHGFADTLLYRCLDEDDACAVAETVADVTGLLYEGAHKVP